MNITHTQLVKALAKPGSAIIESITRGKMHLLHMAVGVVGEVAEYVNAARNHDRANAVEELGDAEFYMEGIYSHIGCERQLSEGLAVYDQDMLVIAAGDLLDQIKRVAVYNKFVDYDSLQKALNTMERELAGARSFFDITRQECIDHNIAKLSKRYSEGTYSDKAAQQRADKE